jgi:alpha-mannosidase
MRRFPNHQFAASSAQQYAWLEELYPDIFEDVTEMVKADRFIPVGGAWIEHDCILPSGESLCRQYLYGQRYFENKFGMRSKEAWLPDTFGYASQLPQILRLAGMEYFFTQKVTFEREAGKHEADGLSSETAVVEQHQLVPTFHIQLGVFGRNASACAHDSCQLL